MSQEENCQKCNIQYLTSLCTFESKIFLKTIVLLGLLIWTHRRRKEREAKAKVVASVWGADFFQFLAALAVLPRSIWKDRMLNKICHQMATNLAFASVSILLLYLDPS